MGRAASSPSTTVWSCGPSRPGRLSRATRGTTSASAWLRRPAPSCRCVCVAVSSAIVLMRLVFRFFFSHSRSLYLLLVFFSHRRTHSAPHLIMDTRTLGLSSDSTSRTSFPTNHCHTAIPKCTLTLVSLFCAGEALAPLRTLTNSDSRVFRFSPCTGGCAAAAAGLQRSGLLPAHDVPPLQAQRVPGHRRRRPSSALHSRCVTCSVLSTPDQLLITGCSVCLAFWVAQTFLFFLACV